jgi:hypothetical protein
MINEVSIEGLRDYLIRCGYGQVGGTVVEQLRSAEDSLCAHRDKRRAL